MTSSVSIAEDVVQDCFVILWNKRSVYDGERGSPRAFLLGIARNLILKRWRDERAHTQLDDDALVAGPVDLVSMERADAVARAIQALPALQREALILAEYEDLSLEEIVRATGADLAAVKSRLHRARVNLRILLAPLLEGRTYGT
jgi:RNA polymerase sigma-70 factor (ECF subfamily)